ncbi:hypothetical protein ASswx1_115 [Aeromonas phage Asswx_1]|uniref:Uncharacterized protein n=1 Tax=Aeromonas phage Asswx_1 TaxID=2419739 RepID=A0A411B856_9CAUD|nr:hypothetical protein ASswx1_115 [Aeromonas phage Asswx_1]
MFESINTWLFTLSGWECFSLVLMVVGTYFHWNAPLLRIAVINNKLFGDGKLTVDQHPIGTITEVLWYYGIYYFVTL